MILPVVLGVEPGKGGWEGGVFPASGEPGGIVDLAQGAQGLDQMQFAMVELLKVLVTSQHVRQLAAHVDAVPREQHPEVLHRGSHAGIVEIDEVRTGVGPQQIAAVTVAVQPDHGEVARSREAGVHADQCHLDDGLIGREQVARDPAAGEQQIARAGAEGGDVQARAMREGTDRADGMDAADQPANPLQDPCIVQFR